MYYSFCASAFTCSKCPSNIQLSKIKTANLPYIELQYCKLMVGLGRIELPTSPLSGVRSSQLSYRPGKSTSQAPTWWSWSGSNRRPPECKSGALPTELQPLINLESRPIERDTLKTSSRAMIKNPQNLSGDPKRNSEIASGTQWNGTTVTYSPV